MFSVGGDGQPIARRIGRTQNASPTSCADRRRIASSRELARTLLYGGYECCVMCGRVGRTGAVVGMSKSHSNLAEVASKTDAPHWIMIKRSSNALTANHEDE